MPMLLNEVSNVALVDSVPVCALEGYWAEASQPDPATKFMPVASQIAPVLCIERSS